MNKVLLMIAAIITISSCNDKRLDEKSIIGRDIKVSWYVISAISSSHEFVEVSKDSQKEKIMEANQGTIDSIFISRDTIFIKRNPAYVIYNLKDSAFGYKINCSF